ncbi:MAG: PKD domain-containing protein [Sphingobacteriales bacterium]|nr:MAG: PKD domain-containing protein [Sphingobacteriales bacterium]
MIKSLLLTLSFCCLFAIIVQAQPNPCGPGSNPVIVSADIIGVCNGFGGGPSGTYGSISVNVANGTLPYTYSWSHNATINTPIAIGLEVGNYCVTVTDINGCYSSECYDVEPIVNITIESDPVIYCDTPFPITYTLTAYGTGGIPGYTYLWNNSISTPSFTASPSTPTTYTVTVTDSNGCYNSASSSVQANFPVFVEPATCGLCNGSLEIPTDNNYQVSGSGIPFGSIFSGPVTLTGLCQGTYQVTDLVNNCSQTAIVENIDLPFTADALFTTSLGDADTLYGCTGQIIQFTAPDSNLTVDWDFGEPTSPNNTSALFNLSYIYQNPGTYTVALFAVGCTDDDTFQRIFIIEQGIAPDITCASLVCPGDEESYTTSAVCDTYNWTVTGGNIIAGQNTAEITVVWDDVPEGTVELTIGDCDGSTVCDSTGSILVPIISNNHQINGPAVVCQGDFALYSLPQYGGVAYNWSIVPPTAGSIVWQNFNQAGINWVSDGVVRVGMSSFLLDCSSDIELPVEVNVKYLILGTENVCAGSQTTYSASLGLHNWTVTGNASIMGTGSGMDSIVVEAGASGSYTVSALPVNLTDYCNYPQQFQTNITPLPATPVITGEQVVCPENGYTYQIASPETGKIYFWTITGGVPASGTGTSLYIVWQPDIDEFGISIIAQNPGEPFCTSEAGTLTVTPLQALQISGETQVCEGTKAVYAATPLIEDLDYFWTVSPPQAGSVVGGQGSAAVLVQWNEGVPDALLTVSACGLSVQNSISILPPVIPSIVQSGLLCPGDSVQLSVSPDTFASYLWEYYGYTTNSITTSYIYNYKVTVTDNNGCQSVAAHNLYQNLVPKPYIYEQGSSILCIGSASQTTIYAAIIDGYTYQWFVNNVPIANYGSSIIHTATSVTGNTSYSIEATSPSGCKRKSSPVVITQIDCSGGGGTLDPCFTEPGSNVSLSSETTSDCNMVNFVNNSTGIANYYVWNFDDDSPLVSVADNSPQNHVFDMPGYYYVRLSGIFPSIPPSVNPLCNFFDTELVIVPLKADFDFNSSCLNEPTSFTNLSMYLYNTTITGWNWDFGDGTSSVETNPAHTYASPGDYPVTLTISNDTCTSSITKTVSINNLPDVSFSIPGMVCEGEPLSFIPADNPDAIKWHWNFGNSASVSIQYPEQSYPTEGTFNVSLTVTGGDGCVNTGSQTIEVLPVNQENITQSATTACEGDIITLYAPTGGASWLWSDGSSNSSVSVTQSGSFKVTVTQPNGCQYTTPPQPVSFIPLPPANIYPDVNFMAVCPGTSVVLNANAGPDFTYLWNNGQNSPAINIPYSSLAFGGVDFYVTVTEPGSGCFSVSDPITLNKIQTFNPSILPNSAVAYQLCNGESLTMTASHPTYNVFIWNTGHIGNSITVDVPGVYTVSVTDPYGCTTQTSKTVGVNSGGDMSAIPLGCYDFCELDTFLIPNLYAGYQWLLNGLPLSGATSNEFVPPQSGDYQLKITTVWGCQDTSDIISLNLIDCLDCIVSSSFSFENTCSEVLFTPLSDGNGTLEFEWNFGDGNTSTLPNPIHVYAFSGTYNVCLITINTAADADVCTESYCEIINIVGSDVFNIITDSVTDAVCGETNGMINITVSGVSPPFQYLWSDNITDEDRTDLPAGDYDVSVTDSNDCSVSASFNIPELPVGTTSLVCVDAGPDFITVSWTPVDGATGFEISFNGGAFNWLSSEVTVNTFYGFEPNTEYTVSLLILAAPGCTVANQPEQITCTTAPDPCVVSPPSAVPFIINANCGEANGSVSLILSNGQPPYTYFWSNFTDDASLTNIGAGNYSVTVTDALGCTVSATAEIGGTLTAPVLSCLSATENEIVIAWETVFGASGYELSIDGNPPLFLPPDFTQFTYTGLSPFNGYTFNLSASASEYCGAGNATVISCMTAEPVCVPDSVGANITADLLLVQYEEPVTLNVNAFGLWGSLTYEWTAGGLPFTCQDSICTFYPLEPTTYTVLVTDIFGCTASASIDIDVRMPNRMLIPNAFSPNGDAINSTFRVAGYNIESYRLSVWNRWGEKVYDSGETTDIGIGWDGRHNDKDSELGVYVYMANVRYTDGMEENLKGNVTLIR